MDKEIIQAYLWQDVIRIGFCPTGDKDVKKWLSMYGRSIKDFWEIDEYPPHPQSNGSFTSSLTSSISISFFIEYSITNLSKFAVNFLHVNKSRDLMWIHDVDGEYFSFPEGSILRKYGKSKKISDSDVARHIESVLDGLLFHPCVHQHIESLTNNHEIRIGGGIANPFVFLFQLRYQLCPDETAKNEERRRLISLFEGAIISSSNVPANELLLI